MNFARTAPTPVLHATLIAAQRGGHWRGVLIRGPSGAGKSDLALRAILAGWKLVADDRVRAWTSGGAVYGGAPATIAGLIEVRGLGLSPEAVLPFARLMLVVEAAMAPSEVERMPEACSVSLLGIALPQVRLPLCEPSVVAKLDRALDAALRRQL